MKKVFVVLVTILFLLIPISTYAATPRIVNIWPSLTFSGTTAKCSLTVTADSTDDEILVIVKLWQGNTCVASWTDTGEGYLYFNETKKVTSGKSYKMTVDVTINNVSRPTVTDTGTCP